MGSTGYVIGEEDISTHNAGSAERGRRQCEGLRADLAERGIDFDDIVERIKAFSVVIPSWALATGGTRFGRFAGPGEPRTLDERLTDAAQVHRLTGCCPRVSLHIPWDRIDDSQQLLRFAADLGIGFDAVNSNTFQDQPGQEESYKFGSLANADPAVRSQAVAHNIEVIRIGESVGSKALSLWIGDGGNYPGQMHGRKSFRYCLDSLQQIYEALPADWRLLVEYKMYEPAFYSTVINDWGTAYVLAERLGPKAAVLVDLGHHAANTNIEMVVARLIEAERLGGFHFNDSKYGDDDLTSGSIRPYQLFLVFCELVDAAADPDVQGFAPTYMIDQSHNVKDPLEAMLQTVDQLQQGYAKALLVDRSVLADHQGANRVLDAEMVLQAAYQTDVRPLVAEARVRKSGAADPIGVLRKSGYRERKIEERR